MLRLTFILFFVPLIISWSFDASQLDNQTIVKNYYDAYNQHDYASLKALFSENIEVKEMGWTVLKSKRSYIELVEWGEVFNAENELIKISVIDGKVVVIENQKSDRIQLLYGEPIKAKTTFTIKDEKITEISTILIDFDDARFTKRKDAFENWLQENHPNQFRNLNALNRTGGETFKRAMELYQKR